MQIHLKRENYFLKPEQGKTEVNIMFMPKTSESTAVGKPVTAALLGSSSCLCLQEKIHSPYEKKQGQNYFFF